MGEPSPAGHWPENDPAQLPELQVPSKMGTDNSSHAVQGLVEAVTGPRVPGAHPAPLPPKCPQAPVSTSGFLYSLGLMQRTK